MKDRKTGAKDQPRAAGGTVPHVVIVGGGFGGLYAARALARHAVRITVVDRHNYHIFSPLAYQVATAALSPGEIAQPIRSLLRRHRNVNVVMAAVVGIDLETRRVQLRSDSPSDLAYDYLILAAGARHAYFGHDEWAAVAPGLKTIDDALEIRRRILSAYEAAEREQDPAARSALLTFVLVGGGPTGVELAGAIGEIARHTLRDEYRSIDPASSRILLLEAGPRLLPSFPESLSASAQRQLETLGVEVRTGALVTGITPEGVQVGDETISSRTALWAAGVEASPLAQTLGAPLDRSGRVLVASDLTVPEHPEAYVIGDLAAFLHQPGWQGKALPGVAQVAIQQGKVAAANVWRSIQGESRQPFRFVDPGSTATIGRAAAVAFFPSIGLKLSGFIAWMAWLMVHLFWLIGFDNRLLVLVRWAWAYFSHRRGARLITGGAVGDGAGRASLTSRE